MEQGSSFDLYVLPEGCISNILSLTSPLDACRLSAVSSVFQSAASSDTVWERFLPSDIHRILSSSVSTSLPTFSSKKELFLHLCDNPLLIDRGTKTFALEKCSGKKCFMIGARDLTIVWGDTPIHWNWRPLPESRFSEVAVLLDVCWLEIRGKIEARLLSPNTQYGAYLVFKFTDNDYGFEELVEVSVKWAGRAEEGEVKHVSLIPLNPEEEEEEDEEVEVPKERGDGWMEIEMGEFFNERGEDGELEMSLMETHSGEEGEVKHVSLIPLNPEEEEEEDEEVEVPKERRDGWMEIEMGEFFNERGEDGELEMSLMETHTGDWKSGLIIQGIDLRPKENR